MGLPMRLFRAAHNAARRAESTWFDWTHHVQTHGKVSLQEAGIAPQWACDSQMYVPGRAANIRAALKSIPVRDLAPYTFVDLGSGKGRGLFVAGEFPFHRIVGVERSARLHREACCNIATFRYRGRAVRCVEALEQDATTFVFPQGPLVLYMFNPFGAVTMQAVLDRLRRSLQETPRHVVVILLWPIFGHLVAAIPGMRPIQANKRYEIYEAYPPIS